ncbi:Tn3 family transposase [Legionella worsleiensis]|uniref:Tn3 transposase DDE domain protein n=1 Tax=Legionella worsleiensis TaxID=45076 RepID=A0A0W1AG84_9GAMM|nr:Tn3 family transposase [Legionella worsleiensis]KTD80353.1 Tn3 transposase DDE domain protein [Legionella worsleiensis]STY32757.1 Transposase and inactivated derivatives, TnpA family [Legionella worsleiensis]
MKLIISYTRSRYTGLIEPMVIWIRIIKTTQTQSIFIVSSNGYLWRLNKRTIFSFVRSASRCVWLLSYPFATNAATCKSEEFNDFIDWITFGKDGVIHENNSVIQQKKIAFGRMVANAVMFHTVANTTNVLNQLSSKEVKYDKDDLSILSAYFRENINRYGVFESSRSRQTMSLEFSIHKD